MFGRKCQLPSLIQREDPLYNFEDYGKELKYRLQYAHRDAKQKLLDKKITLSNKSGETLKKMKFEEKQRIFVKKEKTKKLENLNEGPYEVIQDMGSNILIRKNGKIEQIHKNRAILFKD